MEAQISADPRPKRRKKLWEIDGRLLCSIVGTCLSIRELQKINAKMNRRIREGVEDYDLHVDSVRLASEPAGMGKLMQKTLDRKYLGAVRRFAKAGSEAELRELWNASTADGDIPGPYWALMTHPACTTEMAGRAFGAVHMLSHMVGAANRADIRRLRALEQKTADLRDALDKAARRAAYERSTLQRTVDEQAGRIRDLEDELSLAGDASRQLEASQVKLRALEDGTAIRALRQSVETQTRQLSDSNARTAQLEALAAQQAGLVDSLTSDARRLGASLQEAEADRDRLEAICARYSQSAGGPVPADDRRDQADVDLRGGTVVYVGGRARLVPYFRGLVEQANGQFVHHDGGLEDGDGRLGEILSQGDVVLCPVDCVSHSACLRAKRFCKRRCKPFLPLRSAGLTSFVGGLRDAAEALDPASVQ